MEGSGGRCEAACCQLGIVVKVLPQSKMRPKGDHTVQTKAAFQPEGSS